MNDPYNHNPVQDSHSVEWESPTAEETGTFRMALDANKLGLSKLEIDELFDDE